MLDSILDKIKENNLNVDVDLITKAYNFAFNAHKDQKRESGEPYIIHPVHVAIILVELGMDSNTIAAGLLHDVIEDTPYTYEDIVNEFNIEVANLVDGVTKLGKIKCMTKEEQQAENVRKMLLAMAKDIRVIIIKLADRLHNLRTLKYKSPEKQKEKAKETFDIYAPLAHRLGISKIKWELEDLSFRYLHPKEYYDLVNQVAEKRTEREQYIKEIISGLHEKLESAGIEADIDGRPKHFYSIYRKMVNKNKTLDQIFDLTAIRVLVGTVKDCYAVLGIVHTIYKPIPGRFKDYIAMPKPNMYQSLHTTVIGPQGKTFEIQIRTFEMHKTAEYGIAAHWKYKEVGSENTKSDSFDSKLSWLRDMLEWQKETSDAEEFMEGFKMDMFTDEIFVFTPKGVVINLPKDATPVDFAYKIHTDVGNRCVGAKINGKMVTLDHKLKTGEIVEILTSAVAKGPNIDWLTFVTSNQAKTKIKQWFRKSKRVENLDKGKELLEKECKKQLVNFAELSKQDHLDKMFKKYNFHNIDDLYAAVGSGMLLASTIVVRLKEDLEGEHNLSNEEVLKLNEEQMHKNQKKITNSKNTYGIRVKGVDNIMVRFSKCCNPVPGDDIIGFITKGRGVSIHRKDCINLKSMSQEEKNRLVEVSWGEEGGKSYLAEIQVESEDRNGLLTDIMLIISSNNLQLTSLNAKSLKNGVAVISIKVTVDNKEKLNTLMKKIKSVKGILKVYRMNN